MDQKGLHSTATNVGRRRRHSYCCSTFLISSGTSSPVPGGEASLFQVLTQSRWIRNIPTDNHYYGERSQRNPPTMSLTTKMSNQCGRTRFSHYEDATGRMFDVVNTQKLAPRPLNFVKQNSVPSVYFLYLQSRMGLGHTFMSITTVHRTVVGGRTRFTLGRRPKPPHRNNQYGRAHRNVVTIHRQLKFAGV